MRCPVCQSSRSNFVLTVTDYMSHEDFDLQECIECSLIYIQHPPALEDMPRYYANSAGDTMQKSSGQAFFRWVHRIRLSKDVAPLLRRIEKKSRLLDLGTGTGELAHFLNEQGYKVQGVDYYPSEEWANPSMSYKQLNLSKVGIRAEELLWDGEYPTGAILRHSLEHLQHPRELLHQMSSAMRGS